MLGMTQAPTAVLYPLKYAVPLPGSGKTRYQRLENMPFSLPEALSPRFAVFLPPEGELGLIPDQTNWRFGQRDVNALLLSAVWNGA